MTAVRALAGVTLRGLLGRRRALLLVLLVSLPVLLALLVRVAGGTRDAPAILDLLVIRMVMPLVALIVGTAAIGSEIEDGTLVYLLVKPIARWRTALAKVAVAAGLSAVLVVPPVIVTGLLIAGGGSDAGQVLVGFVLATLLGSIAYGSAFTALGAVTSRALIAGLLYVLLWEGVLAGLLEGTRFLSVRQATLGVAAAWSGEDAGDVALGPRLSLAILAIVTVGGFAVATYALRRFQVRAGD